MYRVFTPNVFAGRHVPGDKVDNLLTSFMMIYPCYFIHLHVSFCVALNIVQYYKMVPCFLKTFLVTIAFSHSSVFFTQNISSIFRGVTPETKGTAFVVYEDIFDAKNACDHLSGFNVCNRYLVVLYYQSNKVCTVPNRYLGIVSSTLLILKGLDTLFFIF
jgi:hypothetical protein